tara:strand:- start:168 stop:704 length:537 start_codon:yes stop_codon:yes gene_type:complete
MKKLNEGLEYKSLDGMVKPTLHIDEFSSKMGDDDDIAVISFYVTDDTAATDLVSWFEKGYEFILDADKSPGEIEPNKYLVYIELQRRIGLTNNVHTLLDDLTTLTEWDPSEWLCVYGKEEFPFSEEQFKRHVPLSPHVYRSMKEGPLNSIRTKAGLPPKPIYDLADDVRDYVNTAPKR